MAEQPQTIVQPAIPDDKPYGSRNSGNLRSMFHASPIYDGNITDAERKIFYNENVHEGLVANGLGVNSFDPDYSNNGAPLIEEGVIETGGGGLPATPWVPNLNSPGPGSTSPFTVLPFEGTIKDGAPEYGSGLGGLVSPKITSEEIEKQTLGSYISGRSYAGSDGTG